MPFDNTAARADLVARLSVPRQTVLLVGAGSSLSLGYPSWPGLIDELRRQVIPDDEFPPDVIELPDRADFIRTKLAEYADHVDRLRQYRASLTNLFRPGNGRPGPGAFHRTLVRLPFCGIVTTNYDAVIETAVSHSAFEDGHDINCHPVDLCAADKVPLVFEFLRGLSAGGGITQVLHLHGLWDNASNLVLSARDYASRYGIQPPRGVGPLAEPSPALDTLHRKVLWALLTMRSVVFIGFSLDDPAFRFILTLIKDDFELAPSPAPHVAILGAVDAGQQDRDAARLRPLGVLPVFYEVIRRDDGSANHDALPTLIQELGTALGVGRAPDRLPDIAQRMLNR